MLYRIFGKAGSGKRERVLGEVKRAFLQGKRVFVIVPEQGTALYEREVTRRCGNRASLSVEVCNFSRLPDLVLREAGSLCHRSITEEEKKLCLFRVLRAHPDLAAALSVKSTPDGVESLFRELEELRAAGLTEENASLQGADLPKSLSDKIALFSLLRSKMRREIALHFGEEADAEEKLASVLDSYPYFRDAVVAVDSFYDFTAPQEAILRRILRQAETVLVTFPAVKKETELFSVPLLAARRLLRFASEEGVSVEDITLTPPPSFSPLAFLQSHLVSGGVFEGEMDSRITLTACRNAEEEALFLASSIRKAVEKGALWRSFAILSRSEENFQIITLTLEREGIPFTTETKKPLTRSPLAKTLLLAVKIALFSPGEETVRDYLKSALTDTDEEAIFCLEKYVATWSLSASFLLSATPLSMNPEGFYPMNRESEAELERVRLAREKIFSPLRILSAALREGTVGDKIAALVGFLEEIGAERALRENARLKKEKGLWEEAAEEGRAWNCVLERLSAVGRTVGEERVSEEEFFSLLSLALSGSLPGNLPTGQDRVHVGLIHFSRPAEAKTVFLIDLNAGVFPAEPPRGRLLSEEERERLSALGFPLACREKSWREELFLFYLAASFAGDSLHLSYLTGGESGEKAASLSVFGKRLCHLFPQLTAERFSPDTAPLTPEGIFRRAIIFPESASPLLREKLLEDPDLGPRFASAAAGGAFLCEEPRLREESVSPEGRLSMTYSRLEKYTLCRFSYFARYLLEAKEWQKASFGVNVTGSFVHRVLEKALPILQEGGRSLAEASVEECRRLVFRLCREALAEISSVEPTGVLRMQLEQVEKNCLTLLLHLKKEFSVSDFTPLYFEKKLEETGGAWVIPLSDGRTLSLYGTVDRIDSYIGKNGEEYVRVVDYKTGSHPFNLSDVANGLDLQMLLYLFALWDRPAGRQKTPLLPAGVLYLNGMDTPFSVQTKEELEKLQGDPFLSFSREGLLVNDPALLAAQDPEGKGEWIPVSWNRNHPSGTASLVSLEKLGRLKKKTERDFARLAEALLAGDVRKNPLFSRGKGIDPCRWCPYLPICKRKPDCYRPYLHKPSEEEIFGKETSL